MFPPPSSSSPPPPSATGTGTGTVARPATEHMTQEDANNNSSSTSSQFAKSVKALSREDLMPYVHYLSKHMELRAAVMRDRRVVYFRGKRMLDILVEDADANTAAKDKGSKDRPFISDKRDAVVLGEALLKHDFIMRAEVADKKKKILVPKGSKEFVEDGFYVWKYEPSSMLQNVILAAMVIAILSIVMFPVWPQSIKVGIWYISVTLLILILGSVMTRLMFFLTLWCVGLDFWILPNVFDDDRAVADSFVPLYSFELATDFKSTWWQRLLLLVVFVSIGVWLWTYEPEEFEEFVQSQRKFVQDLYDGNLLSDTSEEERTNIDRVIPDFDEFENMNVGDDEDEDSIVSRLARDDDVDANFDADVDDHIYGESDEAANEPVHEHGDQDLSQDEEDFADV